MRMKMTTGRQPVAVCLRMLSNMEKAGRGFACSIIKGRASTKGVPGISDVTSDISLTKKI
jgi:hypothetical protein